tara:strand:- start:247 stop:381 length:135 start_codon:yes stop_codon:yes gene_type:complete
MARLRKTVEMVVDRKAEGVGQTPVVNQVPEVVADNERKMPGTIG